MKLSFVGHASFIAATRGIGVMMDPWLVGTAFNDGWQLYPEPVCTDATWDTVTHIWISHEHPDHLSIATLKAVPAERRKKITILFQTHYDTEIIKFLRSLKYHNVIEMPHGRFISLGNGVDAYCRQVGHIDSGLALRADGQVLLNMNDCQTPRQTMHSIHRDVGPVTLLARQFSIAGWPGNADDEARLKAAAEHSLNVFVDAVETIPSRWVLPFASFVRFYHEDNVYMNRYVNTVDDAATRVATDRFVVMYPGDVWDMTQGSFAGSDEARARYRASHAKRLDFKPLTNDSVDFGTVLCTAKEYIEKLGVSFHSPLIRWVPPVQFYVKDLGRAFEVRLPKNVYEVQRLEHECTVSLTSQAAYYTFAHRWGLPTLGVSGRFQINRDEVAFRKLKKLGSAYAAGIYTRDHERGLLRVVITRRRAGYLWHRKADLLSQFAARLRIPVLTTQRRSR